MADLRPVDFESPPVVETVLSVHFRPAPAFGLTQIVQFWQRYLLSTLPDVEERPRYETPIERFGDIGAAPPVSFQFGLGFPSPRLWFTGGSNLIQMQSDWLAYNWRRTSPNDDYTRFETNRSDFVARMQELSDFLRELDAPFVPLQCEVTYVNHIPLLPEDLALGPLGDVLHNVSPQHGKFLPTPENGRYGVSYVIERDGAQAGRLHLAAERVVSVDSRDPLLVLNLTARGAPIGSGIDGVMAFIDVGHDWVVRGFKDVTTQGMHKRWGYMEDDK